MTKPNVIIDMCGDSLSTSNMQYGYKSSPSTTMCTAILKEVIHHYINDNSNVYCCLLDAKIGNNISCCYQF